MYSGVLGGVMCRQPLQWTKPGTISNRYHRCDNAIYADRYSGEMVKCKEAPKRGEKKKKKTLDRINYVCL